MAEETYSSSHEVTTSQSDNSDHADRSAIYSDLNEEPQRNWRRLIIFLLGALIAAFIVVFGIRWIYHVITNDSGQPTSSTAQTSTSSNPVVNPLQGTTTTPSNQAQGNKTTNPSTTTPSTTGAATKLPNNGPGDIAAIFLASSLAAAGLHYIVNLRRANI